MAAVYCRIVPVYLLVLLVLAAFASPSYAQDEPAKAEEKAAPAADESAKAAAAPAAEGEAGPRVSAQDNFLYYIFRASPAFFFLMLGISMYLTYVVTDAISSLRLKNFLPTPLLAQLDQMLTEKKYKEAYDSIRSSRTLFARVLTAGVEKLSTGLDRAMEAMYGVAEDGRMELEHKVSPIATIGTLGPMLGLLGTVLGMIFAFGEISKGGQPKPSELAEQIGLALVSTLEGITLAIPAIAFYSYFRNRIARIVFDIESIAEDYLQKFAAALKK